MHVLLIDKSKFEEIKDLVSNDVDHIGTIGLVPNEVVVTFKNESDRDAAELIVKESRAN